MAALANNVFSLAYIVEMFIRWSCSDFEFMALIKKLRWLPFLKLERGNLYLITLHIC